MYDEVIKDVERELNKYPLVKESIRLQIEDSNSSMRLIGKTEYVEFVNDLVTYVGASEPQKKVVKGLINKYGSSILKKVFIQIFCVKKEEDWREKLR